MRCPDLGAHPNTGEVVVIDATPQFRSIPVADPIASWCSRAATRLSTDFRIDDPPAHVLATANGKIFVHHGGPFGHATIIPSPGATRGDAVVLSDLTADLLDEEP